MYNQWPRKQSQHDRIALQVRIKVSDLLPIFKRLLRPIISGTLKLSAPVFRIIYRKFSTFSDDHRRLSRALLSMPTSPAPATTFILLLVLLLLVLLLLVLLLLVLLFLFLFFLLFLILLFLLRLFILQLFRFPFWSLSCFCYDFLCFFFLSSTSPRDLAPLLVHYFVLILAATALPPIPW